MMAKKKIYKLYYGDCFDIFPEIKTNSIDLVLADPPYGTTQCKWDSVISLEPLWEQLDRITKPDTPIIMTACQPFTSLLILSNVKHFRYCWVWEKTTATGHLNANRMPMRAHEDIVVFSKRQSRYIPQKTSNHVRKTSSRTDRSSLYGKQRQTSYDSTERYPRSVIKTTTDKQKSKLHPTQKPVELIEYLVKTYSEKGQLVLDFCMGSGTTGIACQNLNRKFIGIEKDEDIFNVARKRVRENDS